MATERPLPDHTEPIVFPPVIPLSGFLLGIALQWIWPISGLLPVDAAWRRLLGSGLCALGVAGFAWMVLTMRRARTPIHNARTPTTLVTTGPFTLTRNPMYLFGSVAYAGLAMVLRQPWSLLLLPAVVLLIDFGVVRREEDYLHRRFGAQYREYCARVRRWL